MFTLCDSNRSDFICLNLFLWLVCKKNRFRLFLCVSIFCLFLISKRWRYSYSHSSYLTRCIWCAKWMNTKQNDLKYWVADFVFIWLSSLKVVVNSTAWMLYRQIFFHFTLSNKSMQNYKNENEKSIAIFNWKRNRMI